VVRFSFIFPLGGGVRQGSLDPERATGFIWQEAEKYRSAHLYSWKPAYKAK